MCIDLMDLMQEQRVQRLNLKLCAETIYDQICALCLYCDILIMVLKMHLLYYEPKKNTTSVCSDYIYFALRPNLKLPQVDRFDS